MTRLARPGLCVINTHPVANHDGDWSKANRFYPLHRAQFTVFAQVVDEAGPCAVVCGDFNISRESPLFGEFTAATGLADAFEGACPPTFRAEYLPAGATPHCIDFILTAGEVTVESTALVFAEKEPLGYVSDHIGLRARLSLIPTGCRFADGGDNYALQLCARLLDLARDAMSAAALGDRARLLEQRQCLVMAWPCGADQLGRRRAMSAVQTVVGDCG